MIPAGSSVRRHSMYSGSFKSPRVLYGGRFFETSPASSIGDMRGKVYAALTGPVFPVEPGGLRVELGGGRDAARAKALALSLPNS